MTATIGIHAPFLSPERETMFGLLGEALGVSFERRRFADDDHLDAWIVLDADREVVSAVNRFTRPCYVVLGDGELVPCGSSPIITFASRPEVDRVLWGRAVTADDATAAKGLPGWLTDVGLLASKNGSPIWAVRETDYRHHYVALPPPTLGRGESLFAHFSGPRLASLLPLIAFVHSLADPRWSRPPLQATFMFDDPNLHWTSYGFIEYREMVRRANAGRYHVSFATIPLDAWLVHPHARAVFKENSASISLLYHGNNHVFRELAQPRTAQSMRRMFLQASSRMKRMEARTGLRVARVMAPPHGACSEPAIAEMARVGFEAVCVSRGSLQHHNPGAPWVRTMGMKPCDIVAGLPIIPRFGLSPGCRNDIIIAALLRQPIVAMTHHQTLSDGYGFLDETAAFVNSLGEVTWSDMQTIARSLYVQMLDDDTLSLRLLSTRATVHVPSGAARIRIEGAAPGGRPGRWFWRSPSGVPDWEGVLPHQEFPVQSEVIEIASESALFTRTQADGSGQGTALAPIARRLLTEARDRALPRIRRMAGRAQ